MGAGFSPRRCLAFFLRSPSELSCAWEGISSFLFLFFSASDIFVPFSFSRAHPHTTVVPTSGATRPVSTGNPLSARGFRLKRVVSHFQSATSLDAFWLCFPFLEQSALPHDRNSKALPE